MSKLSGIGAAVAALTIAGLVAVNAAPAGAAFPGVPENVRFVEVTDDHVDLTFVDKSTAEIEFQIEYKQLGTIDWAVVRTYRDHRTDQPGAINVTVRINSLPHVPIGGCYKVWAVGSSGRVGTAQKCTKEVPHGMKMARMLSWTQTSASSQDGWIWASDRRSLYTEFGFTWGTDYCTSSPDQPAGFDFRRSCQRHDFGYRNYERLGAFNANKSRVDSAFHADMVRKCNNYNILVRPVCFSLADVYYAAVVVFGIVKVTPEQLAYHEQWRAELEANAES
jgi:hypothetical protein